MIYSLWIFDRHSDCIYRREWNLLESVSGTEAENVAKIIFGVVYSLRTATRKLTGSDSFLSYSTSQYKVHYFETPSNLKLVLFTDPDTQLLSAALQELYATLYIEYVIKNPITDGVDNEMFSMSLDAFIRSLPGFA